MASNEAYQQAPGTTLFLNSHSELNIDALLKACPAVHTKNGLRTVLKCMRMACRIWVSCVIYRRAYSK